MGEHIKSTHLPWHYIPVWITITTPVLYVIAFIAGTLITLTKVIKTPLIYCSNNQKIKELIFILCFFIPLSAVAMLDTVLYDAWRHMFFIYPAFLMIALIGLKQLIEIAKSKFGTLPYKILKTVLILCISVSLISTLKFMIENHPFQNVYFNMFAGKKVQPPNNKFELGYWGLSYRQALEYILDNDNEENITIYTANNKVVKEVLAPSERNRLIYTDKCRAKYYIGNYRFLKREYPYKNEFYSLNVDGNKIMVVFKLKEDKYHESRIKFYENKFRNSDRLMKIVFQNAKKNKISLDKMINLSAIKAVSIENYVLMVKCNRYLKKMLTQKAQEEKISLKELIRQAAIWFYNNEEKDDVKFLSDFMGL